MASILSPTLEIANLGPARDSKGNRFRLKATCKVAFNELEKCLMKLCDKGVWYYLEVWCYAEDNPTDHSSDSPLFFIRKEAFPNEHMGQGEEFTYETTGSALDEDPGPAPPEPENPPPPPWAAPPPGQDEIYVRFKLWNMLSNTVVAQADTNVVKSVFY